MESLSEARYLFPAVMSVVVLSQCQCSRVCMVLKDHLFMVRVCHGSQGPLIHGTGLPRFLRTIYSWYGSAKVLKDHLFTVWVCHGSQVPFIHGTGTIEFRTPRMCDYYQYNQCCDSAGSRRA